MRIVAGVFLLVVGISYPLVILFWLNRRLSQGVGLSSGQIGRILAFNGIFPVTLIAMGLGFLSPGLWDLLTFKVVLVFTAVAALILFISLMRDFSAIGGRGGNRDRGTSDPDL